MCPEVGLGSSRACTCLVLVASVLGHNHLFGVAGWICICLQWPGARVRCLECVRGGGTCSELLVAIGLRSELLGATRIRQVFRLSLELFGAVGVF